MPAPLLPFDVLLLIFAPLFDGLSGDNERTGTAYALLQVSRAWKEAAEEVYWRRVEFDLDSPRDRKGGGKAGYILSRPEVAQRVVEMRADWDRLLPQHRPLAKAAATVLSTSTTLKKIDLRLYRGHLDFNPTLYLEDTFLDPPFRHCLRSFTYHLHTPTNSFLRLVFSLRHFPVLEQLDIHAVAPRTRGYDGGPLWGVPALVPPAHSLPASPPLSTSLRSLRYSIVGLLPALEQTLQQTFSPTLTSVSFQGHISPSFWRWSTTSPLRSLQHRPYEGRDPLSATPSLDLSFPPTLPVVEVVYDNSLDAIPSLFAFLSSIPPSTTPLHLRVAFSRPLHTRTVQEERVATALPLRRDEGDTSPKESSQCWQIIEVPLQGEIGRKEFVKFERYLAYEGGEWSEWVEVERRDYLDAPIPFSSALSQVISG